MSLHSCEEVIELWLFRADALYILPYLLLSANGISLGQVKVDDKSNETTAIPPLLRALELEDCIVTIDAMGCQTEITKEIIKQKSNYVIALKENQKKSFEEAKDMMSTYEDSDYTSFRADERLKKAMKRTKIHRSNLKPHSMLMSEEQIEAKLTEYFATNPVITRRQFQFLCQLLKPTACRVIKRLADEGKLKNIASKRNPVYMPVEGYFGK